MTREHKFVAFIQAFDKNKTIRHGSGYLVTAQLVLTAWHVVYGEKVSTLDNLSKLTIDFLAGSEETYEASVFWQDQNADICLLKLTSTYEAPKLKWGQVLRDNPTKITCRCCGFPNAATYRNVSTSAGFEGTLDLDGFVAQDLFKAAENPAACGGDECVRKREFPKRDAIPLGQGWG